MAETNVSQPLAAGEDVLGFVVAAEEVVGHRAQRGLRVAGEVQRRVAGDPVEPRLERQRQRRVGVREARVRVDERLLERVVGRGGGEEAAAVARERRAVAVHDGGERALVAGAGQRDQARVRGGGERGGAELAASGLHG